ncbi:ROK family protein [Halobacillus naozhouensis]|uniref:ROK family protein n=1 Tax=Halobacillus naozhouensis TaxID=554880 RepID=A0ABY8J3Z2_9BACI|nr:ROK family protein [Halobacillus naozhouensis]WFT75671.1 ROK family protein [Halobacillus naozhouensis]
MYLAIDLGGTYVKYGLIDLDANIHEKGKEKTPATKEGLLQLIHQLSVTFHSCKGIAISSPGAISNERPIKGSCAIPYLIGWKMKQAVEKLTGKPVNVENDANCAGIAEIWKGAAKGKSDVLVVVIGTGIGGTIIKEGYIHKGAHLHGGEFGYMLVSDEIHDSNDVWSRRASTKALVHKVAKQKHMDPDLLTGEEVFQMADQGDPICEKAIEEFYHLLAIGLYNLQYIYDPEMILISGGVSARDNLVEEIDKRVNRIIDKIELATITPRIGLCYFRQNANLLGAVYSFIQQEKSSAFN